MKEPKVVLRKCFQCETWIGVVVDGDPKDPKFDNLGTPEGPRQCGDCAFDLGRLDTAVEHVLGCNFRRGYTAAIEHVMKCIRNQHDGTEPVEYRKALAGTIRVLWAMSEEWDDAMEEKFGEGPFYPLLTCAELTPMQVKSQFWLEGVSDVEPEILGIGVGHEA